MTKGSIVLNGAPTRRWVRIFDQWFNSPYIALVIHCKDSQQCRNVQKSSVGYRYRTGNKFWSHMDGNDIYLIRPDAVKKYAVAAEIGDNGMIQFCVQESLDAERDLYNRGMID